MTPSIVPNVAFGSAQTVLTPGTTPIILTVPLKTHDGAILSSVTVNWIVSTPHSLAVPPKFRVLAVIGATAGADFAGAAYPVSSPATGADANGFFYPPVQGAGWYNNGQPQSFTIPVDGGALAEGVGLNVDNADYFYVLEIQEESGVTGFPFSATVYPQISQLVSTTDVVPNGNTSIIDGVTAVSGTHVLLVNQNDPTQNGVWYVYSGGFTWFKYPTPFDGGTIFFVHGGAQQAGTYWQSMPARGPSSTTSGLLWLSSTAYASDDTAAPLTGGIGLIAKCTTGGTTGATEPVWPALAGENITDGSVIWTMQANPLAAPAFSQIVDPQGLNTGCGAGFAVFGNIWLPVACNFTDIQDCRFE
jgi:hypothetical protein